MLKAHVASICFKYFRCFRGMLQVLHMDVVNVDQNDAYVASVSDKCCKRLFKMFHLFQTYVCKRFDLDVDMFHTYVASVPNVLVLYYNEYFHVASCKCLSKNCICCNGHTRML
jgi:hypothetical protein